MPPVGFEPTISAGERPQTYALDGAATGIGTYSLTVTKTRNNLDYFVALLLSLKMAEKGRNMRLHKAYSFGRVILLHF